MSETFDVFFEFVIGHSRIVEIIRANLVERPGRRRPEQPLPVLADLD